MAIIDFFTKKEINVEMNQGNSSVFSYEMIKQICDFGYWMNELTKDEYLNPTTIRDSKLKDIQETYLTILYEAGIIPDKKVELQRVVGETIKYKFGADLNETFLILKHNTTSISLNIVYGSKTKEFFYNKETKKLSLDGIVVTRTKNIDFDSTVSNEYIEFENDGKYKALQITFKFPISFQQKVNNRFIPIIMRNVTFPLNLIEVYQQLSQIIGPSIHLFYSVIIEYSEYNEKNPVSPWVVTDSICVEEGRMVNFVTTKQGKTVKIDNFSSWALPDQELSSNLTEVENKENAKFHF